MSTLHQQRCVFADGILEIQENDPTCHQKIILNWPQDHFHFIDYVYKQNCCMICSMFAYLILFRYPDIGNQQL